VKARGRSGGQPAKLTGERADHARNLLNAGMTVSAVARSMGVSRAAVHRAMERIASSGRWKFVTLFAMGGVQNRWHP